MPIAEIRGDNLGACLSGRYATFSSVRPYAPQYIIVTIPTIMKDSRRLVAVSPVNVRNARVTIAI